MPAYDDHSSRLPGDRTITSPSNAEVKALAGMRKRANRGAGGSTLVEGFDELSLAVQAGALVTTLYYCPDLVTDPHRLTLAQRLADDGADIVRLGRGAFAKASYRQSPDGWLAVVPDPHRPLSALRLSERPLVLVAEGIEKPGNLGAMVRTADAAGVDAVIAASPVTDWGNPNVVRASKGAVFAVPVASATTGEAIDWLRGHQLAIVVASPNTALAPTDVDLTGAVAIVVGAEHAGVSDDWQTAADCAVSIPMVGRVNSLNVATSAAVMLYEAVRQRSQL